MKKSHISSTLLAAAALVLSGLTSQAVPLNTTFSFHENGEGMLELPNGAIIPLPGPLASDPGPGGLLSALAFTLHPQESQDAGNLDDLLQHGELNPFADGRAIDVLVKECRIR